MAGSATSGRTLLFIVDTPGARRNAPLIGNLQARAVAIDQIEARDIADAWALILDADLADVGNVTRLKDMLAMAPEGQSRVVAVDYGRRLEMLNANALGATRLLRRPLSEATLKQHLHIGLKSEMEDLVNAAGSPTVGGSIASAADALLGTFEALTTGGALNLSGLSEASEEVAEAIAEAGFPEWLEAVRAHHQGTFQHCLIVTGVITTFAQSVGMSRADTAMLTRAGLLHDVGKAAISVEILDKPGRLTEREMELIRQHPGRGYDYLMTQRKVGADILSAVRSHHEYLNGSGYPDGLSGSQIGDIPRIMTVCDIYGALIERRSYKPPMPPDQAMAVLEEMAGAGKIELALVRALYAGMPPAG
ncbi:MAG: HD domain-containing phosphohydrolase [Devosia sp.]